MSRETTQPRASGESDSNARPTYRPNIDLFETDTEVTLRVDLPGADPAQIDVQFEQDTLSLSAPAASRPREGRALLTEYGVGDYARTFRVSESIDAAGITAEYDSGVLTLHLPKVAAAQPRRIAVSAR